MNTTKLKEALEDLRQQHDRMQSAISQLEEIIRSAEDGFAHDPSTFRESDIAKTHSYIDDAVIILHHAGKPLHIREILNDLKEMRGQAVSRNTVEASINRHVLKSKVNTRLARFGPSIYGLPEWKERLEQPTLVQSA